MKPTLAKAIQISEIFLPALFHPDLQSDGKRVWGKLFGPDKKQKLVLSSNFQNYPTDFTLLLPVPI